MKEILNIEFCYSFKPTPEQHALLAKYTGKEIKLNDDGTLSYANREFHITIEEAFSIGSKFEVKGRTRYARLEDIEAVDFSPRIEPPQFNAKCNVVVAGTTVINISEVMLLADACTDGLQDMLNDGWRILAICVQPDQRRPDYILGKLP